jgi:cytochrome P450
MSEGTNVMDRPSIPENVPEDRVVDYNMFDFVQPGEDFHQAIKRFQGPNIPSLIWTPHNGGHWLVTRRMAMLEIYNNPKIFSSRVIVFPKVAGESYDLIPTGMDAPDHKGVRQIVDKILNLREVRNLEAKIREIAIELIDKPLPLGRMDFAAEYATLLPVRVFMEIMDLPQKDGPALKAHASQILRPDGNTPDEMAASVEKAIGDFYAYLEPIIDARWAAPGRDGVAVVVNSEFGNRPMVKKMALSICANLLLAGLDTVVGFLGFMMLFLARNPSYVKQMTERPEAIPSCVEELFRRFPIVGDGRILSQDFEFDGVMLKEGDMIQMVTALSGLDDQVNEDPWTVDFQRKRPLHETFGAGVHRCAGLHLARTEVTVTLQEWLKRIPEFGVVEGTVPRYLTGHVATVENIQLEW